VSSVLSEKAWLSPPHPTLTPDLPLTSLARSARRYRVCKHHSTQLQVQLTGSTEPHRFCQQCCAFQPLACFDGQRR